MKNRAQESTNAIERMYVTMRHLFNRGFYKPMGISGESLREALLLLRPEIYGTIAEKKTELNGLLYVLDRLPIGIEECRFINLISDEGYRKSQFQVIIPSKRRRNCYRIDDEQMNIEITRGRSDIYDILTHLTFLFIESHKIAQRVLIEETGGTSRDWQKIESFIQKKKLTQPEREIALIHIGNILGRTFEEIVAIHSQFSTKEKPDRFIHIIYWLGKLALDEIISDKKRVITFSPILRERLGHHIYGEIWANTIKKALKDNGLLERPLHIISANMHSVMNCLFAKKALSKEMKNTSDLAIYEALSEKQNDALRQKVIDFAHKNGMISIKDTSGTNIDVQIFDTAKIDFSDTFLSKKLQLEQKPVLFVMDYAFGEQAFETIDELLKPYKTANSIDFLNVVSISIMGKAGILEGEKGDLMIPSAHIFEGTADNYPFENEFSKADFEGNGLRVFEGTMVTVLGTSLQNKDILNFFRKSTWNVIGLEMEGVHYQKAIQSASKIRKSIRQDVKVRYAYYASDNPLETGSTLASGGLGTTGVKPTYLITEKILKQIFNDTNNS
ncbi:DUF6909 family protein [Capnocytophaga catalasegens]|uniref:SIR2-like domain-containing protein n=1 Tax=Capnocytophaga catalasegens TaxID=1004260 RepID=A0AAV5AV63_9FLAO|nr:hypothetical protein [Capnocytophaga catalasegens]GIZ14862.1 hypothetical protein RCZ03_08620 [Capnocytophaga catalasegens]GJM49240.1 hypothetical protein RCZ15_02150 [Capnocytophaga catalasegens]GJM52390.1 hypothetical protein RCZ16_07070 [Capnocytophaga catalasegens]